MKITEEVLKELGFIQQNPSNIWDFSLSHDYKDRLRITKIKYNSKDEWMLDYNGSNCNVTDIMNCIKFAIYIAHKKGVTETQDKLSDALGLDRLLDKFKESFN